MEWRKYRRFWRKLLYGYRHYDRARTPQGGVLILRCLHRYGSIRRRSMAGGALPGGAPFVGKRFQLPWAEGSTTVFQTTAASDGLYWAKPQWFRFFGKDVAGELEAILDGTFCAAKNGLPPKPIFQQNHPSYKDNPVAKEILIKIVTAWFDSRVL